MKLLCCHPSGLLYTKGFLRLEPLGVELVAAAVRQAGHHVRLLDLQNATHADFFRALDEFRPDALCFGLNYLPNIPEVIDLCKAARQRLPSLLIFVGGHSASFTAHEILEHAAGAIDCVIRGEGEETAVALLAAAAHDRRALHKLPGVVTPAGEGPAPALIRDLDAVIPARDLLRQRQKYFIGVLDPCASIEFTRGCPWDCAFCSAWTFYGRNYRQRSPERIGEELAGIREPGVFIVDDVAFIHPEHGMAIGQQIEKRRIRKQYYLETRGDVLLRNKEVFRYWKRLGLGYMFIGVEAIDEEGLKLFRKRSVLSKNFEALEFARSLDIRVAVNIIADPSWDEHRFRVIREWAMSAPEIVNVSINTPYPGTETWHTEARPFTTHDYRLFDIQHAVLPTKLPLEKFYEEMVQTQLVLYKKHLGWREFRKTAALCARLAMRGQTNFVRSLWDFGKVYDPKLQFADHHQPVRYAMKPRAKAIHPGKVERNKLFILPPPATAETSAPAATTASV